MTNILLDTQIHGGRQYTISHFSTAVNGQMAISFYIPSCASTAHKVPALLYLSGLTCTWENAATKAGAQYWAEKYGVAIIFPDTSPRGADVADDEAYNLGQGAGFYINASEAPWAKHYKMEDYILHDISHIVTAENLPIITDKMAVTGHSMGGHGALSLALKHPDRFSSVSAFAPIVNPKDVPWGQHVFNAYLGDDEAVWAAHDSCALIQKYGFHSAILIDQGLADNFYGKELQPHAFVEAAKTKEVTVTLREHAGYDHSYYFVASFIEAHFKWHFEQ